MSSLSFSLGGGGGGGSNKNNNNRPSTSKPSTTLPSHSKTLKRDHSALLDDPSSDEEATSAKKHQSITHFDLRAGGAVDSTRTRKQEEKKPLVITGLKNRDWKEEAARKRAEKYGIVGQRNGEGRSGEGKVAGAEGVEKEREGVKYGLNVFASTSNDQDGTVTDGAEVANPTPEQEGEDQDMETATTEPKTAEQQAIDALLGQNPDSTLTIPSTSLTEEQVLANDVASAPRAPTLEDYAAVPVEEFGAAMLRGMGWKGPSSNPTTNSKPGKKDIPPAKRPALLGIGADPNAAVAEELGAWGRAAKGASRRKEKDIVYNPLVLKNPKTGERVTEEELRRKVLEQKEKDALERFVDAEEGGKRSSTRRRDDGERRRDDDSRRRDDGERRRDDDERRDRHRSRRERSSSYDREKEREREKRHRRDKDRDYDDRRERRREMDDYDRKRDRDRDGHGHRDRRYDDEKGSSRRDRDRDSGRRYHEDDDRDRRHRSSRH